MIRLLLLVTCLGVFTVALAQSSDTLWVPVTYYDFHSNRTNPEFECDHVGMVRQNMVAFQLDNENKPSLGVLPYINQYLKYWFRDWRDPTANDPTHAQGDPEIPAYSITGVFNGIQTVGYDTAFKNSVIQDSLPFLHQGGGIYQYRNDSFFPLDRRGFGTEGMAHNYSFTMELHSQITKVPGQTLTYSGDDDIWLFVNGQLAVDLGGIHTAVSASFNIDDIPGLISGNQYSFDYFFAERHSTESHILITTNLIDVPPPQLHLQVAPSTTILAGDTLNVFASLFDETNTPVPISSLAGTFAWGFIDLHASNSSSAFRQISDTLIKFSPTEAYDTVLIWSHLSDPVAGVSIYDTTRVAILPGLPSHVVIEPVADSTISLRNDNPDAFVRINSNDASNDLVFAILRDRFGNWVGPANPATWSSSDQTLATAASGPLVGRGQGLITRIATTSDSAFVSVRSAQGFTDDIRVMIEGATNTISLSQFKIGDFAIMKNNSTITVVAPEQPIRLDIFGMKGNFITSISSHDNGSLQWDLTGADNRLLSKGIYLIKARAGVKTICQRLTVIK